MRRRAIAFNNRHLLDEVDVVEEEFNTQEKIEGHV